MSTLTNPPTHGQVYCDMETDESKASFEDLPNFHKKMSICQFSNGFDPISAEIF